MNGAYTVEEIEQAPYLLVKEMLEYQTAINEVQKVRQEQADHQARAQK